MAIPKATKPAAKRCVYPLMEAYVVDWTKHFGPVKPGDNLTLSHHWVSGYYVKEDNDTIWICADIADDGDIRGVEQIPKHWVLKKYIYKLPRRKALSVKKVRKK